MTVLKLVLGHLKCRRSESRDLLPNRVLIVAVCVSLQGRATTCARCVNSNRIAGHVDPYRCSLPVGQVYSRDRNVRENGDGKASGQGSLPCVLK